MDNYAITHYGIGRVAEMDREYNVLAELAAIAYSNVAADGRVDRDTIKRELLQFVIEKAEDTYPETPDLIEEGRELAVENYIDMVETLSLAYMEGFNPPKSLVERISSQECDWISIKRYTVIDHNSVLVSLEYRRSRG